MKAIVFDIRLNSLYSIRMPFTWQSSLTYLVLPPSAVIGMLANALQRYKNDKNPLDYLDLIENDVFWTGSRLLTPCIIKSYTTSAIVKWEDKIGGKFTNALGREFAYSRQLQISAILKNNELLDDISKALKNSPLTCGDSESPVSLDSGVMIKDVTDETKKDETFETNFPVPFTKDTKIEGNGKVYLMHERCLKREANFPMVSYMVPIREEGKIISPSSLTIKISYERVFKIDNIGYVVTRQVVEEDRAKVVGKKSRKKRRKHEG